MKNLKFSLANKVRKVNSLIVEYELGQTDIKIVCKTLMKDNFIEYSYTLVDENNTLLYIQIDGVNLDEYYIYQPLDTQNLLDLNPTSFNVTYTYKEVLSISRKIIKNYLKIYLNVNNQSYCQTK